MAPTFLPSRYSGRTSAITVSRRDAKGMARLKIVRRSLDFHGRSFRECSPFVKTERVP